MIEWMFDGQLAHIELSGLGDGCKGGTVGRSLAARGVSNDAV